MHGAKGRDTEKKEMSSIMIICINIIKKGDSQISSYDTPTY